MLKTIVLLLLALNVCSAVKYFDARGIDYCKLKCDNYRETNTGCFCEQKGNRRELVPEDKMEEFRQVVVDTHNELRNKLARGDEPGYPEAANMHMLRYDLELEYLARCYGLSRVKDTTHEKCRTTTYCDHTTTSQTTSESTHYFDNRTMDLIEYIKGLITTWYEERPPENIKLKTLKQFEQQFDGSKHHIFTRFVWANVVRIGCVFVRVPLVKMDFLVCNYASRGLRCSAEQPQWSVYKFGKKCTLCDSGKCDKDFGGKYDALCREDIVFNREPFIRYNRSVIIVEKAEDEEEEEETEEIEETEETEETEVTEKTEKTKATIVTETTETTEETEKTKEPETEPTKSESSTPDLEMREELPVCKIYQMSERYRRFQEKQANNAKNAFVTVNVLLVIFLFLIVTCVIFFQ